MAGDPAYIELWESGLKLKDILRAARNILVSFGIEKVEAEKELDILIEHITGMNPSRQLVCLDIPLVVEQRDLLVEALEKRRLRMPVQYITGLAPFDGSELMIEPGVFIPRCDTETLLEVAAKYLSGLDKYEDRDEERIEETVETNDMPDSILSVSDPESSGVLQLFRGNKANKTPKQNEKNFSSGRVAFLEIGAGSGAISIALLKRVKRSMAVATDISDLAVSLSLKNAFRQKVADRMQVCLNRQWWSLGAKFDAIISNPPYIPRREAQTLQPEVGLWEPPEALFGSDDDGCGFYREIATRGSEVLRSGRGFVAVEVGDGQAEIVKRIFESSGWSDVRINTDLNRNPRVVSAMRI